MVNVSYMHLPAYPLEESIGLIEKADQLGFYGAYSVDETWWKDMWLLFAAASARTSQIKMGPSVTHVILRDPTLIVQQLATLDELSGGRADLVVSFGNISLLAQYNRPWKGTKPLSRVIEAQDVMRSLLDEGAVTHEGEFFSYSGLWTLARPVQERMPVKLGAMGGPRSFEVAGERFDGLHHALGYSRENYDYVMQHVKDGAEKAGRDWESLDLAAWVVWVCGEDSAAAKEVARIMVAFYLSAMPEPQLKRHGISSADLAPIFEAFGAGDVQKAVDLTSPETGREAVDLGDTRRMRCQAASRHPPHRDQPCGGCHHRPLPGQRVHREDYRQLPRRRRPTAIDPRSGDAGIWGEPQLI